jgi:hypothetical protein
MKWRGDATKLFAGWQTLRRNRKLRLLIVKKRKRKLSRVARFVRESYSRIVIAREQALHRA